MEPLPVDEKWREYVIWQIGEAEKKLARARTAECVYYYETCLRGWRRELQTIEEAERYWHDAIERIK